MDSLLNIVPCGYVSFRDDGGIVGINQTLSDWLQYSHEALIGRSIETIFTIATRIFYNTHFFPLIKLQSKADEIYLSLSTSKKKEIPVLANALRREEANGYIIHCVFMPVYQRRKYEEEILNAKRQAENALKENKHLEMLSLALESRTLELDRQYSKLLSINHNLLQFGKIISHDLHEPLRKIQLFTNIVATEEIDKLTDKSKAAIQKIGEAAERLKILITGLQEYINADVEKDYADVDLNVTVASAKEKAVAHRKFDDFDLSVDELPTVEGYKTQLQLLFFHLIDNAIQFREPSRKLQINITSVALDENVYKASKAKYKYAEHVKIYVSDNGMGFDDQYKEYVLQLLKKLHAGTDGLGIGLPIIKKITDNHAGSLYVNSESGKGSTFTIILPVKVL